MASAAAGNRVPANERFTDMMRGPSGWSKATSSAVSSRYPSRIRWGEVLAADSRRLVRAINHGYADLQLAYLTVLRDLGCTHLDPEAALNEANRIVDGRGLCGIALLAVINGRNLSAPETESFFDRIDEAELTAFIHSHGSAPQRRRVVV